MKALIVEDDFTCRVMLQRLLAPYGEIHVAVNGKEAIDAFVAALDSAEPYHVVFLDIILPEKDGQRVLKEIREIEKKKDVAPIKGVKIIMTTSLSDKNNLFSAFNEQCDAYIVKPVQIEKIKEYLTQFGLI